MKLMPKKQWIKRIVELEKAAKKSTKAQLKKALIKAIEDRIPKKRFGILFSGGVDSTLVAYVCKQTKADFICYCVGLKDSPDLFWAKEIAKKYKFKLKTRVLKFNEMEQLFKRTKKMLVHADILSVGVGSVLAAAIEIGKKDKIKDFFTGMGSEEIFAGYHFHDEAEDVHKECWKRLKSMWKRDLRVFLPKERLTRKRKR
jgi:asparagine synthase (glutamine-hydrolysing)